MPSLSEPALTVVAPPGAVTAVALVLHGGREASHSPVRARQLAVLRMRPFAAALTGAPGLAVARLRFRVRGWNGELRSPVADTDWALATLNARYPLAPVALVGHSMGGRTAVHVAGTPSVRAVALLAPWIEQGDPVATMTGRRLLVVHGDRDRITSPRASIEYARAAAATATSVGYVTVRGGRHAMLARAGRWHALAAMFVRAAVLDERPDDGTTGQAVSSALAGNTDIVI